MATHKKIPHTKRGAKRPAENPEIRRAHARMSGKSDPYTKAMEHVTSRFGELIIEACDRLGEQIATAAERHDYEDMQTLAETLLPLFKARWELGITGGNVSFDAKAAGYVIESAVEKANKVNGTASEAVQS